MDDYRKIAINGYVTIRNGDKIIVDSGRNAIVRQGMRHFISLMSHNKATLQSTGGTRTFTWRFGSFAPVMRFGTDNGATTQLMDTLVSELDLNTTNISNSQGAHTADNGNVLTKYVASFAAGTLNAELTSSETLGEVGIFLQLDNKFEVGDNITPTLVTNQHTSYQFPTLMFARYSLGNKSFIPDENEPVTVDWEFRWKFI